VPSHASSFPLRRAQRGSGLLLLSSAVWTATAALAIGASFLTGAAQLAGAAPWAGFFAVELLSLVLWVGATALGLWLAGQLTSGHGRWLLSVTVELAAGFVVVLAVAVTERRLLDALLAPEDLPLASAMLPRVDTRLLGYVLVVVLTQAARYFTLYRERELRAAGLEAHLARTKLQVLKMQLQPHFLFNALNATAELVHADPDAADRMITRLSDFLRLSLDHAGHLLVPFGEEIDFIRAYVDIEQIRWGDRLTVEWDCTPDTLDAAVPTLVWQPVLENAIRHGCDPRTGMVRIHLGARRWEEKITLFIRDWGPGLPPGGPAERIGLRNTRERVRRLYGDRARFELAGAPEGGTIATLRLPYTPCTVAHTPVPLRSEITEPA